MCAGCNKMQEENACSGMKNKLTSRSEVLTDDETLTIPEHNNHYNSFNMDAIKHHSS
jgi:hypothetical protein